MYMNIVLDQVNSLSGVKTKTFYLSISFPNLLCIFFPLITHVGPVFSRIQISIGLQNIISFNEWGVGVELRIWGFKLVSSSLPVSSPPSVSHILYLNLLFPSYRGTLFSFLSGCYTISYTLSYILISMHCNSLYFLYEKYSMCFSFSLNWLFSNCQNQM